RLAATFESIEQDVRAARARGRGARPGGRRTDELLRTAYGPLFECEPKALDDFRTQYQHAPESAEAESTPDYLLGFGALLERGLPDDDRLLPHVADLAHYLRAVCAARYLPSDDDVFDTINRPATDGTPPVATPDARPALCPGVSVEAYQHDVVAL